MTHDHIKARLDAVSVRSLGEGNRPCVVIEGFAPQWGDQLPCMTLPFAMRSNPGWTHSGPDGSHDYRVQLDAWADSATAAEHIIDRALVATQSREDARRPAARCELNDGSVAWRAGVDLTGRAA